MSTLKIRPTPIRAPKREYHHGDLRKSLVAAARAHIEAHGPEGLSLREIARTIGVSHNAPYRHFADREALLAAVMTDVFRDFGRHLHDAAVEAKTPQARFTARGRAYVMFAVANPGVFALMFSRAIDKAAHPELAAAAREAYGGLEASIGTLVPGARVPATALAAWAFVHGLATLILDGALGGAAANPGEVERLFAAAGEVLGAGIKALAEGRGDKGDSRDGRDSRDIKDESRRCP